MFRRFHVFWNLSFVFLHFVAMCYCFVSLRCLPFNWIYVALISLYSTVFRSSFMQNKCFHLISRHFVFTLLLCCLVRDDEPSVKPDLQCLPGTGNFSNKITKQAATTTNNKKQPETTSCKKPCSKRKQCHQR